MAKNKVGPTIKRIGGDTGKGNPPKGKGKPANTVSIVGGVSVHRPFTGRRIIQGG